MDWLFELHRTNPTAQAIAILSLVCLGGMSLGSLRVRGVKLGTSGVLFVAIVVGHFSKPIDHHTLEFVKEFGLILFVFCIGLQLGPGFFASFRQSGVRLNFLASTIVVLGALMTFVAGWLLGLDEAGMLGVFAGATTNTPSLGAAQQTLSSFPEISADRAALPALAYAVTYPVGIVGIIGSLLILKKFLKIDVPGEVQAYAAAENAKTEALQRRTLVVENANLQGIPLRDIPALAESNVVISRIRRREESEVRAASGGTILDVGDHLLVVGAEQGLDHLERVVGRKSLENLLAAPGSLKQQRIVVTNKQVLGKSVQELDLDLKVGVVVTRVTRGDVEMTAVPSVKLQFGDWLNVVGTEKALNDAVELLGNSLHDLNETQFIPFFAGISLGIALGTLPLALPGLPQPLKFGLAAGPLMVAIVLGRIGRIGRLVWHMPRNANLAFREFGIALFFGAVGLMAGPTFFATAFSFTGLLWLICGVCVTMVPLLTIGISARQMYATNYVVLSGLLAGSMTDPPALAFANTICQSEAPTVAYATVYPWTMLMRIVTVQIMTVLLCG